MIGPDLTDILISVGRIGLENDNVEQIDINPLIMSGCAAPLGGL